MEKIKAIIDSDPGIDDTTAIIFSLLNPQIEIKLITTVAGNIDSKTATRNACYLMDLFNTNIPISRGANKALKRISPDARWLHGVEGLGHVLPPRKTKKRPIKLSAVEAMYQTIKKYPNEITLFVLGPQTNIAELFYLHPDVCELLKEIVFMGGSPYANDKYFPYHDSFNAKTDPEALQLVLESGVPLVMVPSSVGRHKAGLREDEVAKIMEYGDLGKFLHSTYIDYIEPNLAKTGLRVVATNDLCAIFYKLYPSMFKIKPANITVDVSTNLGRTYANFCKDGAIDIIVDVNREKFMKKFFETLDKFKNLKLKFDTTDE